MRRYIFKYWVVVFIIKIILSILLVAVLVIFGYFYLPVTNDGLFDNNKNIDCLIYNKGRIETQRKFESNSQLHEAVNDYLKKVEGGWNRTLVTYAPTIYIRSDKFRLIVWEQNLIFGGSGGQFIKEIDNTAFAHSIKSICEL